MTFRVISSLTSGRISGVDVFAFHLTEGLRRQGVDARVILTNPDRQEQDALPLPRSIPIDTLPPEWRSKQRYRRRALFEYLVKQAPCIYLPNYDYDHSPISARLPSQISTIGILHSDDPMHYDHLRTLGRFWDAVVAVSAAISDRAREIGDTRQKIHTIPYGVPCESSGERTTRPQGPLHLLYVGRLEQSQKRVLDMLAILDRLHREGVPAQLTMCGDGPLRGELEERGRPHIEAGRLSLLPTRSNDQMAELYRQADVFLLTSAFEGLPVSLLEAMSYGCVPVVTRVRSGVTEVVRDGESGFLVNVGDIARFVKILRELAADPDRRLSVAQEAQRVIREGEHSVDRMIDRYRVLFEKVIADSSEGQFRRPRPYFGELYYQRWNCRVRRNIRRIIENRRGAPRIT